MTEIIDTTNIDPFIQILILEEHMNNPDVINIDKLLGVTKGGSSITNVKTAASVANVQAEPPANVQAEPPANVQASPAANGENAAQGLSVTKNEQIKDRIKKLEKLCNGKQILKVFNKIIEIINKNLEPEPSKQPEETEQPEESEQPEETEQPEESEQPETPKNT